MTRYRLGPVDIDGPATLADGFSQVQLPDGRRTWIEGAALAPYLAAIPDKPVVQPAAPSAEFGAWFSGAEPASDYVAAARAGLRWARIRWFCEGGGWQAQADWAGQAIALARAAGLRVLLEYWAWAAPRPAGEHVDVPTVSLADWAALSDYLAVRFGGDVAAVQPCNEPDLAPAGLCPDWPAYVSAASRAWRAASQAVIVAPGMAMQGYSGARSAEWARLRECRADVDALALHCYAEDYGRTWPGGAGLAGQVATLRAAAGGWTGPVWLTETGGIAGPVTRWQPRRSEAQQAADAARVVREARAAGVAVASWYAWRDQAGQAEQHGLCRQDGTARPALAALADAIRG